MDFILKMAKKKSKTKSKITTPVPLGVALASSGVNNGLDREMTVTGRTTEGTPIQVASFRIIQPGLRWEFEVEFDPKTDDQEDEPGYSFFETNDGEIFAVLKE